MLILSKSEQKIDGSLHLARYSNSKCNFSLYEKGKITLLDGTLSPKYEYQLPDKNSSFTISRQGDLLAAIMGNGNHLAIFTAANQLVYEQLLPNPPVKYWFDNENGFQDCWFDADGLRFWCMKLIEGGEVEIQIRDTSSWQIQRKFLLEDPFGWSSFSFYPHPENQILALWAAAGQDGQQVYWLYDDGIKIHAVEVACLADTSPPEFHPAGSEFLVLDSSERELSRFSFPECNLLGQCQWPWLDSDDGFGYYICYLSDARILINTNQGRMHIIDLNKMDILEEVILIGHEPRLCRELYPDFQYLETEICGDLEGFYRFDSDSIFSIHSQLPCQEFNSRQKTLVIFGEKELFGSLSEVQQSAPYSQLFIQSLGIS